MKNRMLSLLLLFSLTGCQSVMRWKIDDLVIVLIIIAAICLIKGLFIKKKK